MATIRIDTDTLQEHFESSCDLKVTSFCWSTYNGVFDVEYDVDVHKELIYDDDLFTEQEEYNHLEETYKELQERFNTISTETDAKIKELTDKVAELNKKINTRSVWYKPWG